MSRLSNVAKHRQQLCAEKRIALSKWRINSLRNPKPLTKVKNLDKASPKRRAEWI
jgi:hypothetical protein